MSRTTRTKLRKAGDHLRTAEALYQAALDAHDPSDDLLYEVGAVISDLRSVLDSLAYEAAELLGIRTEGWSPSFPTWTDRQKFDSHIGKDFPGLRDGHPALWKAIERQQPWHDDRSELRHLRPLAKVEVHRHFVPQVRVERRWNVLTAAGGAQLGYTPMGADGIGVRASGMVSFNGQPLGSNLEPLPGSRLGTERVIYLDWLFEDLGVSVLGTLKALHGIVTSAEDAITAALSD